MMRPSKVLFCLLCATLLLAVAVPAWGQDARIRVVVNDDRAIAGQPGDVMISGTSDALPGSSVIVAIGNVRETTETAADGSFSMKWPDRLSPGNYLVRVSITGADGRAGLASQTLDVSVSRPSKPEPEPEPEPEPPPAVVPTPEPAPTPKPATPKPAETPKTQPKPTPAPKVETQPRSPASTSAPTPSQAVPSTPAPTPDVEEPTRRRRRRERQNTLPPPPPPPRPQTPADAPSGDPSAQPPAAPGVPLPAGRPSDDFEEFTDRWRLAPKPFGIADLEYEINDEGSRWDPYNQNKLKGDRPIFGDDKFLILTAISDTLVEGLKLPVPSGLDAASQNNDFFGDDEILVGFENVLFSVDLFKGLTNFKPVDWRIKATLIGTFNYVDSKENSVINLDPSRGTSRKDSFLAVEELFFEQKLADIGPNYDFLSLRIGSQPFNSDFRGFIFSDINLGFRLFGNARQNRYQYNFAFFDRLEKDTNSGLNRLEFRDQQVAILNLYKQDFLALGQTAEISLHYLKDEGSFFFDENQFLARPDATGDFTPHDIEAVYVGVATFGHIGRWNIDSSLYYVFGEDELNPIAGSQLVSDPSSPTGVSFKDEVDIRAYQASLEMSYDRDWWRPKVGVFYASGDDNLADRNAEGFDAIFENTNFAGGGFSFWNRARIPLTGTNVALVNRGSLLPDLSSSKEEGQPNFVNPGLILVTFGADFEITPKLRNVTTINYLQFQTTEVLEGLLFQDDIDEQIGIDFSTGFRYRPYLNENFAVLFGVAGLIPGSGYEDIYAGDDPLFTVFTNLTLTF